MKTKEAIKFLKNKQWLEPNEITDILEMFEEFEECKLFKKMWKAFKFKRGDTYCILDQPEKGTIRDDMNDFERKYFPKPKKEVIK